MQVPIPLFRSVPAFLEFQLPALSGLKQHSLVFHILLIWRLSFVLLTVEWTFTVSTTTSQSSCKVVITLQGYKHLAQITTTLWQPYKVAARLLQPIVISVSVVKLIMLKTWFYLHVICIGKTCIARILQWIITELKRMLDIHENCISTEEY